MAPRWRKVLITAPARTKILVEILAAAVHIPFLKSAAQWQADASGETQLFGLGWFAFSIAAGDLAGLAFGLQAFEAG